MPVLLKTKRLYICPPSPGDLKYLFALQSDPEVMRFVGDGVRTFEEVKAGLVQAIRHQKNFGFSLGAVFERDTHQFVGRAGLIHLGFDEQARELEVAYALRRSHWGKGYATELAKEIIDWGFENLEVDQLVGVIHPENQASRHVLEKAGMKFQRECEYKGKSSLLYFIDRNAV